MKRPALAISALALAATATIGSGYLIGAKRLSSDREQAQARIRDSTNSLNFVRQQREDRAKLDADITSFVGRVLGSKPELVDSRLRERLNKIGEELQVKNLTVSTVRPSPQLSPAKSRYTHRTERAIREELDFVELDGSVAGEATLEQALRLVHRIQSEPWLKRVHQFKLEPRNNGERFNVTVRLTTLFLPGREPRELPVRPYDGGTFSPYAMLASVNPFRLPPPPTAPPPPAQPPSTPQPPAAPTFPYGQWRLTGVAETPAGAEVWLLNSTTNETRRLAVGESLQQAQLIAAGGEQAEFRLGEDRFLLAVGKSFDDRSLIKR